MVALLWETFLSVLEVPAQTLTLLRDVTGLVLQQKSEVEEGGEATDSASPGRRPAQPHPHQQQL